MTQETDTPLQDIVISPTNGRPVLKFKGWCITTVDVKRNNSVRWAEWRAYETEGGKTVIEQIGRTTVAGETDFVDYLIFEDDEAMTKKLGMTKLAEKLYEELGVNEVSIS